MNNMQSPQAAAAQSRTNAGASWFTAIAGFSLVNAVIGMIGAKLQFIVGLALCELFDSIGQGAGTAGKGVAFVADLVVAATWWFFGSQARKGARWAFIVGMIFYLIDGILFIVFQDYLSAAFHAYVLYRLFMGLSAANELNAIRAQQAPNQPGAWYGGAPPQPGAWPPPPGSPQQTGAPYGAQPPAPGAPYGVQPPAQGGWPPSPTVPPGQYPPPPPPPAYIQQPAPQPVYPPPAAPATVDSTTSDWSQPASSQPLPSHWPAPAQPQSQPAPEPEG